MLKKVLYLIQQSGVLMRMPRNHNKHLGNTFDTVASHSHHVAVITYCLCRMEGISHDQALKTVAMAVFHDIPKARTGDVDFVAKHYVAVDETTAIQDSFKGLEFSKDLEKLLEEYDTRTSLEAKCVKDADSLEQLYQEWVLMWQGNKMAEKWFDSDFNDRIPGLKTESAKKLAFAMKDSNPQEWWWSQFLENDTVIDEEKLIGKN